MWFFWDSSAAVPSYLCGIPKRWKGFGTSCTSSYLRQLGSICWARERSVAYPLFTVKDHRSQKMFSRSCCFCCNPKGHNPPETFGEMKDIATALCHCLGSGFLDAQMTGERSEGPEKYLYGVFVPCFATPFEMSHFGGNALLHQTVESFMGYGNVLIVCVANWSGATRVFSITSACAQTSFMRLWHRYLQMHGKNFNPVG